MTDDYGPDAAQAEEGYAHGLRCDNVSHPGQTCLEHMGRHRRSDRAGSAMTPPVHSGEPETPKTEGGRALLADFEAGRLWADARPHLRRAILAIEREAAALAPGAGLDVARLARALHALDGGADGLDYSWTITGTIEDAAAAIATAYAALGATPDPRPETDPS